MKNAEILHHFNIDDVFNLVLHGHTRMTINGLNVSIRRMECFAKKGTVCVTCGKQGNSMVLEKWRCGQLHVDLYSINGDKRTLMTIDHIIPKSKGGQDHIDNYQPMCEKCNQKKGNKL